MSPPDGIDAQSPAPKRVLVIDDEPRSVAGVIMELGLRGIAVDPVQTRQQAQSALARNAYDAVLLDLMIPERETGEPRTDPPSSAHGFALLDGIRASTWEKGGTRADVPVVVMTGVGAEVSGVAQQLKARHIEQVFVKPVPPVLAAETLVDAMGEKRPC